MKDYKSKLDLPTGSDRESVLRQIDTCQSKVWYRSEQHARARGHASMVRERIEGQRWPYECKWCGLWHTTSKGEGRVGKPITAQSSGIF